MFKKLKPARSIRSGNINAKEPVLEPLKKLKNQLLKLKQDIKKEKQIVTPLR